jgi:hypothetical protein
MCARQSLGAVKQAPAGARQGSASPVVVLIGDQVSCRGHFFQQPDYRLKSNGGRIRIAYTPRRASPTEAQPTTFCTER